MIQYFKISFIVKFLMLYVFNFLCLFHVYLSNCFGQYNKRDDKQKKFRFSELSLNFGTYHPNKYQAQFYNGAPQNQNTLNYIFSNAYWREEIRQQLDMHINRDSFNIAQLPFDIRYKIAVIGGMGIVFDYKGKLALSLNAITTRLKVSDYVALAVYPPLDGMIESYVNCNLIGSESRTILNLGLLYKKFLTDYLGFLIEGGFQANYTRILYHRLQVFDKDYNLINIYGNVSYVPNTPMQEYDVHQGGIGFGIYTEPGITLKANKNYFFSITIPFYISTVRLEPYHERMTYHFGIIIKLSMPSSSIFKSNHDNDELSF